MKRAGDGFGRLDNSRPDRYKEKHMQESAKDQVEGTLHELKGTVKEKAGQLVNDPNLEARRQVENLAG
jgi:hypothetical protein